MSEPKAKRFIVKRLSHKSGVVKEFIVTVDEQDAHLLRSYYWTVRRGVPSNEKDKGIEREYVGRQTTKKWELLHHIILGVDDDVRVCHVNGDSLDNRRANLFADTDRVVELPDEEPAMLKAVS